MDPVLYMDHRIDERILCNLNKNVKADEDQALYQQILNDTYAESDGFNAVRWILGLASILIILVLIIFLTTQKFLKTIKKLSQEKSAWEERFYKGQEDQIDWNKDIVFQAENLPYRDEFEFEKKNLELGDELGSGQFGVVQKAIAKGLGKDESDLEVAVKTPNHTNEAGIKDFLDELKIMMFLQRVNKKSHCNIINLLGSVIVDIKNGEVYAIMELCHHGSLYGFITRNDTRYADQIMLETEKEKICKSSISNYFAGYSSPSEMNTQLR